MNYHPIILIFASILWEALPFIVLGVILAGLLEEFVPQQLIARMVPRSRTLHVGAICVGGLLGLIFPMCECGVIPVMRRLLRKGVPLSVCICYMLAGPIINVVVITSTWVAFSKTTDFGGQFNVVSLRVGLGFVVAVLTSLIVDWQQRKHGITAMLTPIAAHEAKPHGDDPVEAQITRRSWSRSLGNITETALHDFADIMAFLILGALIASVARVAIAQPKPGEDIRNFPVYTYLRENPVVAIPVMMAFAILFCLCSEADAFVAANFQPTGLWPASSKMAFLVLGPMLDLKLLLMYTRVFRRRLILTIVVCLVVQVFIYTTLLHSFWPRPATSPGTSPPSAAVQSSP